MAKNNVVDNENILIRVDQNNLVYIEPNSIIDSEGNISSRNIKQEELVMYVNLEADIIPRSIFVSDNEVNSSVTSWRKFAINEKYFLLSPISSHGSWAKKQPFNVNKVKDSNSQVAVITRARIKNRHAIKFWRSVPPVVDSLKKSPGLLWSIGIGESPIGLQGTFSLWTNEDSVSNFAFHGRAHAQVIKQTREIGWYAEELFARFEVISKAE